MSTIRSIGTYLPPWGSDRARVAGDDEDAVTLAVAAGVAALDGADRADVSRVVLVSRDLPLLEGGNSAALLAGLGVSDHTSVAEIVGGAPATLDAVATAAPGTLVIGSDTATAAGAAAVLCGPGGADFDIVDRITRSLPIATRDAQGHRSDYADPRLQRVKGLGDSLARLDQSQQTVAAAGLTARDSAAVCGGTAPALPTTGASSTLFALAALAESGTTGRVVAVEQATVGVADLSAGNLSVVRDEHAAQTPPSAARTPGSDLPISLAAYERAFDAKLRLEAARCTHCGTLSYPQRFRCIECGAEDPTETVPLPRDAEIYTLATIRVPVPGLISPYTVAVVELGDSGVRVLVRQTGSVPGSVKIGDTGRLVFRLVAVRSGVPDYGYGFLPGAESGEADREEAA